jgi:Radical SAM superfamily
MAVVRLLQIDGKIPNIALMRLAAHHREMGDEVVFHHADHPERVKPWWFGSSDKIYASAIFSRSVPVINELKNGRPDAIVGGTGTDAPPLRISSLEAHGITTLKQDYSIYPKYDKSIGFSQRGCRLQCSFCVVPHKEGRVRPEHTIYEIWRGDPWPRELVLLDNDFFGQPEWKARIEEIREGNFKVSFNQGINARCLTDEAAEAIASVRYYDDDMKTRRIYTAWDSRKDEERLFAGLNRLVKYGVKPDQIMVYMLIGYWPGETAEDREYRRRRLREFGARPYPMAYITADTPPDLALELRGFQRWVIRRADVGKNCCSWEEFKSARYRPEKIGMKEVPA